VVCQVDFTSILAANESERQQREQTRCKQEMKNQRLLNKILQEMEGECFCVTLHDIYIF